MHEEKGVRVLIADDSVVSRHVLFATLVKWGYEVIVASDGVEAWNILQREDAPTLAVLDWMMPGLTGPEVCRMLRQKSKEPYTYVLLLTSKNLKEDLIEGMDAGADDYVIKPFEQQELKVRLRSGTRIVKLQAELLATREALREQASHDSLTRLWNRGSILDILDRELHRSRRERQPIGVALIDIDHFKSVNDTYGHIAGDAVLMESARRMQSSTRHYDALGRYGGEEFLLVLPGCNEDCVQAQAERVRLVLSGEPMKLTSNAIGLTASFGTTSFSGVGECTAEMLVRAADEALYSAKRLGRNRVEYVALHIESRAALETIDG